MLQRPLCIIQTATAVHTVSQPRRVNEHRSLELTANTSLA